MDHKLFSQQVKSLNTVDVRFDKRSDLAILNQDCIDKYQENAYLLGQIFSVNGGGEDAQQKTVEAVEEKKEDDAAMGDAQSDEDEQDDFELGQVMNEIAAQNFAEKETAMGEDEAMEADGDEEIAQLKDYLTELQTEFQQ